MVASLALFLSAIAGGTIATYAYDDEAPVGWRIAAGSASGAAVLGLAILALALRWGLNGPTLAASAFIAALPLLLLTNARLRARVCADTYRVGERLRSTGPRDAISFALAILLALVVWRVLDRVVLEQPAGMSTGFANNFGDLPFHAGAITRFAFGDNFPPEHPSYAGAAFTYPYIADLIAAAFVRAGSTIRQAMLLQNSVLLASLLILLTAWFHELTGDRRAAKLACALVFLSGGFGWWMLLREMSQSAEPARLLLNLPHDYTVMNGTPWRWGNLITALLIPQRSLLLGLPIAALVFTLLARVWDALPATDSQLTRRVVAAGVLAGLLPLVHAHTYVVVFGVAACQAMWFWRSWRAWWPFFACSAALGVPQALWLAASGSVETGRFLGWHFGWDHGTGNVVLFWLRNTGLFIPLLLAAVLWRGTPAPVSWRLLRSYLPFTVLFIVPNLLRLSPWIWDNIKFLVYWHIASAPLIALLLLHWWRQRSAPARAASVLLTGSLVLAGGLDIWRVVSHAKSYELFTAEGLAFARLVRDLVPPKATVVHSPIHNHPVFLSGRRSFMGYPGHVWSHGLPHSSREADIKSIYRGGPEALRLLELHQIDYVVIGPIERKQLTVNQAFFDQYPKLGVVGGYQLYRTGRHAVDGPGAARHSGSPPYAPVNVRPLVWTLVGTAIAVAAVVLRLYDLELKPLHHDEGVNGYFLRLLVEPPYVYRYNPRNYHGPTLYYFSKVAVDGLGLTTFAVRLVPALAGIVTVFLLLGLRRWIGSVGALTAACLVAVSPGAVYLSRYFIHEALLVCFILAAVVAGWRFAESRAASYALLTSFSLGLAFATKETAIISAGVLSIAVVMTRLLERFQYLPVWPQVDTAGRLVDHADAELKRSPLRTVGLATLCAAVFLATTVVLFSSWFTYWTGVSDAIKSFAHWTDTGNQVHRHAWYTYVRWLANAEAPILIAGLLGALSGIFLTDVAFVRFASLWAVGTLLAYSLIPYKTPWLTLNFIVPLAICGGWFAELVARRGSRTLRRGCLAIAAVALVWSVYHAIVLNFVRYDDDRLIYPYAHTSREVLQLVKRIDAIREAAPPETAVTVAVLSRDHFPLSWYLRSYRTGYHGRAIKTSDPIYIASTSQEKELDALLGAEYERSKPYALRPGVKLVLYVRRDLIRQ